MPNRIAGITIEIDGNATPLQKELKGIDKNLKTTQNNLKDVNRLLKLDPGNVDLLKQKQKLLNDAISDTKKKLDTEKEALAQLKQADQTPEVTRQMEALERQIADDEQKLKGLKDQMRDFGSVTAQQLKVAGDNIQQVGNKISDVGKKLSTVSAGAAAVGGGLLKMGYDAVQNADDLNTLSKQTGFSTEELQKMQYASDLVDVSVDDITGALRRFKKNLDPSNDSLKQLGISATDAHGELRNSTDVFYEVLSALGDVENATERDKLAMDLFGRSADSLAGIVDDGGEALKAYGEEAQNMGLILDQDTLDALNNTNDTIDQLKANLAGTMAEIGADVASVLGPALESAADLIKTITEKLRELSPEQMEMILKIVGIVAAIGPLVTIIGNVISIGGALITGIGTIVGVLGGPLTLAIGAAIAIGVALYKNWDEICAWAATVKDKIVEAWNNIKDTITSVIDNVKSKIDGFKQKVTDVFDAVKDKIKGAIDFIKGLFNFEWSLPKLKLPHFRIEGSFSLTPPSVPHLAVDWYKKAYDNPVMFTSPTVLATPNGLKGFGDGSGAEIVMGLNKLKELAGPDIILNMNVTTQPGQDNKAIADYVADRIMKEVRGVRAVWA